MADAKARGAWLKALLAEDFSERCLKDRLCVPCSAVFCSHCCGAHHSGGGHEVVAVACADDDEGGAGRDSFCLDCAASFSAALCAHHRGHETVAIVVCCDGRHCVRCTGAEPWFYLFCGVMSYKDEQGHILVPMQPCCGRGKSGGRSTCRGGCRSSG
ncbi:hypothetical protein ACP4OV_031916 [Aristida adscensionis]